MRSTERAVYFLGFMLVLGLLVPDQFLPWPAFRHDFLIAVGFSPLIINVTWGRSSIPRIAFPVIFLSILPLLQMGGGMIEFLGDGWISWLYMLSAALAMISATTLVDRSALKNPLQELRPIVIAFVIAGVLSVGISLVQWLKLDFLPELVSASLEGGRYGGNLAQPNQLATLFLIGLACSVFLFENKTLNTFSGLLIATFLLFGLVLTQSRMAFLALIFALALYFGLRRKAGLRLSRQAVLFLLVFFLVANFAWPLINSALLLRNSASMLERTATDARFNLWISIVDAIARSPWFGYGWGQVPVAQQAVALEYPATYAVFESAHNIFLDIAVWAGVPIVVVFFSWLFLWFRRQIVNCCDPLSFSILLAVGVVFCHAIVEYPLAYAYILLPTCFFIGALSRKEIAGAHNKVAVATFFRAIFAGVSAIALIGFFIVACEYIRFENDWRSLRFSLAKIGVQKKTEYFKPIFLTQLREYAELAKTTPERGMPEERLLWMKKVSERFGQPSVLTKYAVAAALNGKPEIAARSIALICRTQRPHACGQALNNWKAIAADPNYPELKAVNLEGWISKNELLN